MESVFKKVLSGTRRYIDFGHAYPRKMPHIEAIAWIAYFAEWDYTAKDYRPSQNWIAYYNESYRAIEPK